MALVILVRHGQTDENLNGKISGQGTVPLNIRGQEQARLAGEVVASLGVTHLVSSPLVRARQTADLIAQHVPMPVEENAQLREVEYGDWEGQFFQNIRSHPMAQKVSQDPSAVIFPNGESLLEVQRRGVQVVEELRQQHPQGIMVAVSHGDVVRTVLAHYLGMPFNDYRRLNIDNGALSVIELFDHWVRVKAVNFVPQVGKLWLQSHYPTWRKVQELAVTATPS